MDRSDPQAVNTKNAFKIVRPQYRSTSPRATDVGKGMMLTLFIVGLVGSVIG
jgi:hypothetical protein